MTPLKLGGPWGPPHLALQGLDLLWTNEETDVMLLRLEDEIPEGGCRATVHFFLSASPCPCTPAHAVC